MVKVMQCPFNHCYFSEKASLFQSTTASLDEVHRDNLKLKEVLKVLVFEFKILKSVPDSTLFLLRQYAKELELTDEDLQNMTPGDRANSCLHGEEPTEQQ